MIKNQQNKMKKIICIIVIILLIISCEDSKKVYNANITPKKEIEDSLVVYKENTYVYKCFDSINNSTIIIDLIDIGYVGFNTNKITTYYKVDHYKLITNDSLWRWDSTIVYFTDKMPVDSMKFNRDETIILVYSHEENGNVIESKLNVISHIVGLKESRYIRTRNKNAIIRVGETQTPVYINQNPLK